MSEEFNPTRNSPEAGTEFGKGSLIRPSSPMTLRQLGPRQRRLIRWIAGKMNVSERWALKHYAPNPFPAEDSLDAELNPTMLAKQFSRTLTRKLTPRG